MSGGHCWVIHRGGWPQGRGSARTLVAGGLPLSDGERFIITYLRKKHKNIISSHNSHYPSLPINLTRHFSRPRLCWCSGCGAHPVGRGRCATLWFLHLLLLHRGGCTERVEDDVLVFFPIASLRVRCGFDITLQKWAKHSQSLEFKCIYIDYYSTTWWTAFKIWICLLFFKLTTRFLLQVLDSAGEFGWQLERAGLSGDGVGVPMRGDSGSPFSSFDPGWQVGKAPGLREPPTSAGTLQEKHRKCYNELNQTTDKSTQTRAAAL